MSHFFQTGNPIFLCTWAVCVFLHATFEFCRLFEVLEKARQNSKFGDGRDIFGLKSGTCVKGTVIVVILHLSCDH